MNDFNCREDNNALSLVMFKLFIMYDKMRPAISPALPAACVDVLYRLAWHVGLMKHFYGGFCIRKLASVWQ